MERIQEKGDKCLEGNPGGNPFIFMKKRSLQEVAFLSVRDMQTKVENIYKLNLFNKLIVKYKPFYHVLSGKIQTFKCVWKVTWKITDKYNDGHIGERHETKGERSTIGSRYAILTADFTNCFASKYTFN